MPWQLEIHIIDVWQGESSLIIARNPATGARRSMLIDGGLGTYARTVHNYILAQGLVNGPDHVLVTHYDKDHTNGITALLVADNVYHVSDMIGTAAANWASGLGAPNARPDRAAAGAAVAYAVALGCYNDPNGANFGGQVGTAVTASHLSYNGWTDAAAADDAVIQVEHTLVGRYNPWLIPKIGKMRDTAVAAGVAAAASIAAGDAIGVVIANTRTAVFNSLRTSVAEESRFQTGGIYQNAHVIDIGHTDHVSQKYTQAVAGIYTPTGGTRVQAIGTNRVRTGPPALGSEILWNSGNAAVAAPANSPAVFVVARLKRAWNGPNAARGFDGPQADNADSIGLILRFNRFFYFTGGDLPSAGEELIATAVMGHGLVDPQGIGGATFAPAHRIACFKCGHHGAPTSTSQNYLNTAQPRGAFISCGKIKPGKGDNHPSQVVVDRLHAYGTLLYFYLTNCKYPTNHIPASQGDTDQLGALGNKSRVTGVNLVAVVDAKTDAVMPRQRGNIRISLNEAESTSPYTVGPIPMGAVLRRYHVRYFEEDVAVNNFRIEDTIF